MTDKASFRTSKLDDIIHARARLGIVAFLARVDEAAFAEIRAETALTDGNLSTHLKKLKESGYVQIKKSFHEGKPKTQISLTRMGRAAWHAWVEDILALMKISV